MSKSQIEWLTLKQYCELNPQYNRQQLIERITRGRYGAAHRMVNGRHELRADAEQFYKPGTVGRPKEKTK